MKRSSIADNVETTREVASNPIAFASGFKGPILQGLTLLKLHDSHNYTWSLEVPFTKIPHTLL